MECRRRCSMREVVECLWVKGEAERGLEVV
jgi:hypothetical protein